MPKQKQRRFFGRPLETTPRVARKVEKSESVVRELAPTIGVQKFGNAYAWTHDNYVELLRLLIEDAEKAVGEAHEDEAHEDEADEADDLDDLEDDEDD